MKDHSIFKQAMNGVVKLKSRKKIASSKIKHKETVAASISSEPKKHEFLFDLEVTTTPEESLLYHVPSLPYRVIRRLKRGEFPIQARLDLHGKQIGEAHYLLESFLDSAINHGKQHLLIIHGKGSCKIKSAVKKWLQDSPLVLGFSSAKSEDGGTGALYLFIKKVD